MGPFEKELKKKADFKTPELIIYPKGKIDAKPVVPFEDIIKCIDENRDGFLPVNQVDILKLIEMDKLLGKKKKEVVISENLADEL